MMKKALALLLACTLCLTLLAGCGAKGTASSTSTAAKPAQKTDMLLWMPPFGTGDALDQEFWTKALAPWAEENNVNLAIEITPW
ncbi:MAG: sugar ABC transporter substrate-binding protein, partial [Ruthenibacterium sp.]